MSVSGGAPVLSPADSRADDPPHPPVSQSDRLYFEDLPLDKAFVTSGRTITEADVVLVRGPVR